MGYKVKPGGVRIGPLGSGQIDKLGLTPMRDALEKLANGREVNFMLYESRKAALEGIAQSNPESLILK